MWVCATMFKVLNKNKRYHLQGGSLMGCVAYIFFPQTQQELDLSIDRDPWKDSKPCGHTPPLNRAPGEFPSPRKKCKCFDAFYSCLCDFYHVTWSNTHLVRFTLSFLGFIHCMLLFVWVIFALSRNVFMLPSSILSDGNRIGNLIEKELAVDRSFYACVFWGLADEYGRSPCIPAENSIGKTDLVEVFSDLGLGKYTDLFQQQEVWVL